MKAPTPLESAIAQRDAQREVRARLAVVALCADRTGEAHRAAPDVLDEVAAEVRAPRELGGADPA